MLKSTTPPRPPPTHTHTPHHLLSHPCSQLVTFPYFSLRRDRIELPQAAPWHQPSQQHLCHTCLHFSRWTLCPWPKSSPGLTLSSLYLSKDTNSIKSSFSSLQVLLHPSLLDFSHQHTNMLLNLPTWKYNRKPIWPTLQCLSLFYKIPLYS